MPLYVYQVIEEGGADGEVFEVLQGMNEPALTHHPETGRPVRRLLSAPNPIVKSGSANLSDNRLERLGFTKYQKSGDGKYEKTAGSGPDLLNRD
jgi:predicted nucleic acid-binding Zn ribbon protein